MFLFGCHSRTLGLTQHSVCKEKKEKNGVRRDPGAQERMAWAGPCAVACGVCLARAHLPPGSGAVGGALAVPLEGARRTLHAHGVELMQAVEGGPTPGRGGPACPLGGSNVSVSSARGAESTRPGSGVSAGGAFLRQGPRACEVAGCQVRWGERRAVQRAGTRGSPARLVAAPRLPLHPSPPRPFFFFLLPEDVGA